jgi:hypothetical protein
MLESTLHGADMDRAPIHYSTYPAKNAVSRLQERLDAGRTKLAYDDRLGYLPALLKELKVPPSSQMLVFSKTSLQRHRISPQAPRALYFNDDVYVGFCQLGPMLEITAVDPQLGAVFYTLEQDPVEKPRVVRQQDSCLICHASSQNQGMPGHLIRSVYADAGGFPILASGSFRIDHTSPLKQRWGGWYVTGTSGKQAHLGNLIVQDKREPERIDNTLGRNVTDLSKWCRTSDYLGDHSDIVALMVLEHQAEMHNRITRASFLTRQALHEEAELNRELGQSGRSDLTWRRIHGACDPLIKYLLFSGEARLTDRIRGTSSFANDFVQQGPRDKSNRSLRDLDLETRLFKYPCSYLIQSEVFEALPAEARDHVLRRLWEILNGQDRGNDYVHLSTTDRQAILEILRDTKKNLPGYWHAE